MAPSPRKASEAAKQLLPSPDKVSKAAKRIAATASDLFHDGVINKVLPKSNYEWFSDCEHRPIHNEVRCDMAPDHTLPDRASNDEDAPYLPYATLSRLVSGDSDMPGVFSNNENILRRASDDQNTQSDKVSDGSTYQTRIGFDTFDNKNASDFSFTISSKHKDYKYTRRSRTFLCGNDENDYSEFALEWLIEELVEEGDEIVCLRVLSPDSKINSDASIQKGKYRDEGRRLLHHLQAKNHDDKAINLILELAVGKVGETIQRMIETYAPACLTVGTRGRSLGGLQALRSGSVSKYCLQNSPVPVVVVRPEDKRKKKKNKRLTDSKRQGYNSILRQSNASGSGSGALDSQQSGGEASQTEATAVAKAIGLNEGAFGDWKGFDKKEDTADGGEEIGTPLSKARTSGTTKEDMAYWTESPSPEGPLLAMDDDETEDVPEMELESPLVKNAGESEGGKRKSEKTREGKIEEKAGEKGVGIEDMQELQALCPSDEETEAGRGKGEEREV